MARIKQETIVLNDYRDSSISRRTRISRSAKTGKVTKKNRVTFEIQSEPLVHTFDDEALGRGPAEAIRDIIEKQIKAITKRASPATIRRRNWAKREMEGADTAKSVIERYSGGRIGIKPPKGSTQLFNDSDRLSEGLAVGKNIQEAGSRQWVVNVPVNRLTDETFHLAKQLFALVPALKNPRSIIGEKAFEKAVADSIDLLIAKAKSQGDVKRVQLRQAKRNALFAVLRLGKSFLKF